jgi:fucose 4-O-acetylase-like acetyltransferase
MSAGSVIRAIPPEATERAMQWAALLGGGMILACQYFANQPYTVYARSDFWLNSPAQVLTKVGVVLLMLALAFLWTRYGAKDGWSWVRQLGTTSLLVYWVHIELVYGREFWFFKGNLTELQTAFAAALMILLMLGIAAAKTYRHRIATAMADMGWTFGPKPDRVPGD